MGALLLLPGDKYLLQLRDPLPHIFHPGHWDTFGGGIDAGETPQQALVRELEEEIGLRTTADQLSYFTHFTYDFNFAGIGDIDRWYYTLSLASTDGLQLNEGSDMRAFTAEEALGTLRLTPHCAFALWIYHAQRRFRL